MSHLATYFHFFGSKREKGERTSLESDDVCIAVSFYPTVDDWGYSVYFSNSSRGRYSGCSLKIERYHGLVASVISISPRVIDCSLLRL